MKILLCAATEVEIKPTVEFITAHSIKNIDILITGIGMMSAAYHLTRAVATSRPDLLVQAGIGGCLDETGCLGSVVTIRNETPGDIGVEQQGFFHSLFDLHLANKDAFPWKDGKLCNETELLHETGLPVVDGVSVNEISTDKDRIAYYSSAIKAQVESMEGAALHFIGLMEKIPFLQFRSLSNFAGERDKTKWLMKEAIVNLNTELQKTLHKLT
jgi:futalosine hydrolase